MKQAKFSAVMAERLFVLTIFILIGLLVADFIFVTNSLRKQAKETDHIRIKADLSDKDITNVKSAHEWLISHPKEVARAERIVAETKLYQYQNQIIKDFQDYAHQVGVSITGYTFLNPAGAAPGATPTQGTAPAAPAAGSTPPVTPPKGVASTNVTIALGDRITYRQYFELLRLIEQNVTRMQVSDIAITPDTQNPGFISSPSLNILVYIKGLKP